MARLCRPALIVLLLIAALPPWAVAQSVLEDRLFKVDGVTLFLRCGGTRGPGLPVVVMETSSRAHADAWDAVHEPIAEMSRACAVDRPGNGRSGPAPGDLTARGYIDLLQTLLRGAGEDPPYAFVGHSLGGMIARLYALTYAADVAGILLIEPTHEDKQRRLEPYLPRRRVLLGGLPRPPERYPGKMPPFEAFAVELRNSPQPLSVPVIALASIKEERLESLSETRRAGYRVERELWQEVVSRSPDPELILHENSYHHPE